MSVRIHRPRDSWFSTRAHIADAVQKLVLGLVVLPLLLALVAAASLLGLR